MPPTSEGHPMAEYADREHYVPLRKNDLIDLICSERGLLAAQRQDLRQFCLLTSAVFHFEYQQQLESLKDVYAPYDPDSETRPLKPPDPGDRPATLDALFGKFTALLERANFRHLSEAEILKATEGESGVWGINMDVDMKVFERVEVFTRGDGMARHARRRWWKLWRKDELIVPIYRRFVMIFKLRRHRRLDPDVDVDDVYLKIFKDIPRMDIDMLMPGAKVQLTRLDRGLIVYPLAFGAALVIWNVVRDLGGSIWEASAFAAAFLAAASAKIATWTMAAAFGGYGYKSFYSFQVKKRDYSLRLTRSLYYQSLDNNTGVLMRLFDEAEEQECRETFLGYFCLWRHAPPQGWTAGQLDDYVELYLEEHARLKVDFEIDDALAKLERLTLVERHGELYRAVPLNVALERLDYLWDNYFQYNKAGAQTDSSSAKPLS
jgi:hypothetical protein